MKILLIAVIWLFSLQTSFAADEPDNRNPLERYRGDTQFSLVMCKLALRLALSKSELGQAQDDHSDYAACILKAKNDAKASLDKALRTLKKPKAQDALKSYHVAFATALDGIRPGSDERRINYEQRQQSLEGKVTEAWARFEVEQ